MNLYPEGAHWCSREDYAAILTVARDMKAKSVLEFGPGTSTLALIEAGAELIDACEDDPHYLALYTRRLAKQYPQVKMRRYTWAEEISIPEIDGERYDLAVIDGPRETMKRPSSIAYALARADNVLVALEEWQTEPHLRRIAQDLAWQAQRPMITRHTGPLAGAYALIGPPVC